MSRARRAGKRVRAHGRANDRNVPRDELYLAKIIQNARAFGLNGCIGTYYRDVRGMVTTVHKASACCAAGAALLSCDTSNYYASMVSGNDIVCAWSDGHDDHHESVGWAFRWAMEDM